MAIQDDWTINYSAKTVEHTSGSTVYTVLEFFQWLAQTFANAAQMDDDYAFVSDTPTVYRWVNSWAFGAPTSDYKFLSGGSIESSDANDLWSNLYSIGQQESGTQLYLVYDDAEVSAWWGTGNIDILVHVLNSGTWVTSPNTVGATVSGGVWVYAREFGDNYDHNFTDLSGAGRNPIGINTAPDSGNTTAEATVSTWDDVTVIFSSMQRDLNNGNGSRPYDVEVDCGGRTLAQVYERLKYITRHDSEYTINGDEGDEYRSADEGNYTDVKVSPFGTIAGTTVYGARGVWFSNYAAADFVLSDASGTEQSPPNYQKVTAQHPQLISCNVFVAELSGTTVKKNQYTASATTSTTVRATGTIDINKTPQSGKLRFGDTTYSYTGFSSTVITGVSPAVDGESGDFYIPLLEVSATTSTHSSDNIIYNADINVRTVVRKYGFKPFTQDTTFGSNGLSFTPILTDDPQAT